MKKNIAVVAGGYSSEYDISVQSGTEVANWIDKNLFNVHQVIIKDDNWVVSTNNQGNLILNKDDFSFVLNNQTIKFDCAFIIIHGDPGENGRLQGYFETLKIPYTTSGVLASSLTFDKIASKYFLKSFGFDTAHFTTVKNNNDYNINQIINEIGLPCFVKPSNSGSSYGITKVEQESDLESAIQAAFREDNHVLIEEFLDGRELTCGLLKTKIETLIFPPTEIISHNDFFDFEAKYEGKSDEITPAQIPDKLTTKIQELSSRIYDIFNLAGLVRIDFIYSNDRLFFIEANTVPGMSSASIVPQQIRAAGFAEKDILTKIIKNTLSL